VTTAGPVLRNAAVLGCGRSGTSIFGELFGALPAFTYHSEPFLADVDVPRPGTAVAVKVPKTPPDATPPRGCSVSLDDLHATLGEHVVVFWQVRHPLDAICSLRAGIAEDWCHHPRPPDWRAWLDRPLVERCAHHWATVNGPGFDHVAEVAVVNAFEPMLLDPLACAEATGAAVGVEHAAAFDDVIGWADRVQDTNNERFVEALTSRRLSRPDHDRRIGRWRDNLTAAEVDAVLPIVAAGAALFGYALP